MKKDFFPGRVVGRRAESWRGTVIHVDADPVLIASYSRPGQYCRLRVDGVVGTFALARAPGPGPFEFYVQDGGAISARVRALTPGAPIEITAPEGRGFAIEKAVAGHGPFLLCANGSGLAALCGVLDVLIAAGRRAILYVGCRMPGDFIYVDRLLRCQSSGIDVRLVLSGENVLGWRGRTGYIQDALLADDPDLADAWVCLCGVSEMHDAVREYSYASAVPAARILENY